MAAVSEAMIYNARMVPSYVSSNGYYGYVPPKNQLVEHHTNYQQVHLNNNNHNDNNSANNDNNNNNELEHNHQQPCRMANGHGVNIRASSLQHQHDNEQHFGYNNSSDMETDCSETHIQDTPHCQNNHCVIPETARRLINGCDRGDSGGGIGTLCWMANDNRNNFTTISQHRENRKRSYDDPTAALHLHGDQSGRMKKLRAGGGNSRVCHGTGRTGKYGSAAMPNEPSSLCLVPTITSSQKPYSNVANNCCGLVTVGNYPSMNHKFRHNVCETKKCSALSAYSIDYEQMLMETHGCSAYHHYRHHLLDSGVIETEF